MHRLKYLPIIALGILVSSCGVFQPNNSISDHAKSLDKGDAEISGGFTTHFFSTWQVGARGKYGVTRNFDMGVNASLNAVLDTNLVTAGPNGRAKLDYNNMAHLQLYNKYSFIKNVAIAMNVGTYFQNGFRPKWELDPTLIFSIFNDDETFSFSPVLGYKHIFDNGDYANNFYQLGIVFSIITKKSFVVRPEISFNINGNNASTIPLPSINIGVSFGYQIINQKNRLEELEEKEREDGNYDEYVPDDGYK